MPDVAIAQMCSSSDVNENLVVVKNLVEQAAHNSAEMILLPENFAYMGRNEQDKLSIAETPGEGLIQDFIKTLAIQNNIWIIAGTIPLYSHDINRVFAACMVYNNKESNVPVMIKYTCLMFRSVKRNPIENPLL